MRRRGEAGGVCACCGREVVWLYDGETVDGRPYCWACVAEARSPEAAIAYLKAGSPAMERLVAAAPPAFLQELGALARRACGDAAEQWWLQ